MHRRVERQQAEHEMLMKARRSEVQAGLMNGFTVPETEPDGKGGVRFTGRMKAVKLSNEARDLMRAAMARNDRKPKPTFREPGLHVEAYSMDRSSRDESRDSRGNRRRD